MRALSWAQVIFLAVCWFTLKLLTGVGACCQNSFPKAAVLHAASFEEWPHNSTSRKCPTSHKQGDAADAAINELAFHVGMTHPQDLIFST
mmetsp:Transcript_17733/g.41256  ORF Transcript_17733/g.41256 Transcript_17733/m.41256 type:complete len:90 (-) Transcript_17733:75-344(-)